MKLLVLILNDLDKLELLLKRFSDENISGATIINSTGMARTLAEIGDEALFGSLRKLLNMDRNENRTILMVLNESKVLTTVSLIESVVGDLNSPDTGIVFSLPLDFVKGGFGLDR